MPMFVCLFWSVMLTIDLSIHFRRVDTRQPDTKYLPKLCLLLFMLTAVVLYFGHCVFFAHDIAFIPLSDTLYSMANLAVFPLYYFYICSLTVRHRDWKLLSLLLLPALIGGCCVGSFYMMMSQQETATFIDHYLYHGQRIGSTGLVACQTFVHDLCKMAFAFLVVPVFFYGRRNIQRYDNLVNCTYADTEEKSLASLHYMFIVFVAVSALSFAVNIVGRHQFDETPWMLALSSTVFSALLFTIGYVGYHQQFCIHDIEQDEKQADAVASVLPNIGDLRIRIEQLVEKEELFRQPNFKIVDLVQQLGTNRNYIYQAVNREMGTSFNEYVNRLRVDYASRLISTYPDMSLVEVQELSGFNSSTTFYRNFKHYKGASPKEYKTKQRGREITVSSVASASRQNENYVFTMRKHSFEIAKT